MTNRLKKTFQESYPDSWANGKIGYMRYNSANMWHQFAGLHYEGTTLYQDHDEIAGLDNIENFPILSKGITSHILLRLEKTSEIKIYTYYYQACLSKFIDVENKKPGAYLRDLDSEFYSIHLNEEKERIKFSQKLKEYLSDNELEIVNNYTQAYLSYIEQVYSPKGVTGSNQPKTEKKLKPTKTFPEYLLHEKRELLAEKLKTEFSTEKGKGIRLMIESLQAKEPKLLSIENRQRKAIYIALQTFFNRDIGTRQGIFDYDFNIKNDNIDFGAIKIKLDFIIESINKTK